MTTQNIDLHEIKKFEDSAEKWWDETGEFKTLHDINPLRLQLIQQHTELKDKKIIDVGCGGGILAESMAKQGGVVTGIDMSLGGLQAAQQHAHQCGLKIDYQHITAEEIALQKSESYDVVTCMEMLEHVPDPISVITACARLAKPGGQLFFSTLHRNPKAYLFAIVAAEYILNLIPKGTHDYAKFIRPSELEQWGQQAGLVLKQLKGLHYNPFTQAHKLSTDVSVNYLAYFIKSK